MKTARKWTALLLCLVLAVGTAATAFAAGADPEDIAKDFMAMLEADGVDYSDEGLDEDGNYEIDIYYEGENLPEHEIALFIDEDGQSFGEYEWYLMDFEDERLLDVLKTVNDLNNNYRFVTFVADTSDNTITAKSTCSLQGNARACAQIMHYAYDWLPIVLDAVWPVLEAGVKGSELDPTEADFEGTWYFSSITFTEDTTNLTAGTVLTAADMGYDLYVATFRSDGKVDFVSTIEDADFTSRWTQEGNVATLTDETGTFLATMTDEDTIVLDASEGGGYIMTLVREGSEAFEALTTQAA